jgi:brefeldin A-inhibited guanine nucleotide-exchange protein
MLRGVIPVILEMPECSLTSHPDNGAAQALDDVMIKFWFPVLLGFFNIIMNGEDLEIRQLYVHPIQCRSTALCSFSTLDSLFSTLKTYGETYPVEF